MSESVDQDGETLELDPMRAKQLAENLGEVVKRVDAVSGSRKVRVIAVSKLKPAADILALHSTSDGGAGHMDFGENYAQELTEKARRLPRSIRWHMIGGLQTNKCKSLAEQVPNLFCVSSVDAAKKADGLEKGRRALLDATATASSPAPPDTKLRVLVQVNTSGEDSKSGVDPGADAVDLCRHVRDRCPSLHLAGLMTIGAIARSQAAHTPDEENEDFVRLRETRDRVARELGIVPQDLQLSMGMSADFEAAIAQGSDEVRVGTRIFGDRPAKKDAVV